MNDMGSAGFPPELLKRQAVIYVRQSTQSQVMTNLESQRRQYDLVEMARGYGFSAIDVNDDDLGISASGCQSRALRSGSWRRCCARDRSVPSFAWKCPAWRGTAGTGITWLGAVRPRGGPGGRPRRRLRSACPRATGFFPA